MSKAILIHDYNSIASVRDGYEFQNDKESVKHCEEVMRMIKIGTLNTKAKVVAERAKRGIERR